MTFNAHLTEFGPYRVESWAPGQPLGDPDSTIHRLSVEYDEETQWTELLSAFLEQPGVEQSRGLVVGWWSPDDVEVGPEAVVEALVAARDRLPNTRAVFMGDITYEECEVSWITNGDLSPLLAAYPDLEHFGVRGGNSLSLGQLQLPRLQTLTVQSGGLDASVVREVMQADLPELRHLELYLGTDNYGATATPEDITPLLDGDLFPKLRYLGLRDSDRADEFAQVIANAPILERIEVLDLSLGTLSDEGAAALLASDKVKRLNKLDIHHHWCSDATVDQLGLLGIEVDSSDQQDLEDDWRFVAIGE